MFRNYYSKILYLMIFLFGSNYYVFSQAESNSLTENKTESGGNVWAAKWYDDKISAFSFSFDDGMISQFENVRPILNQFTFRGTFYVLPPFLTDSLPGIWRYGTWPMFQAMSLEDHEIGSHTMNHLHLPELEVGDTTEEGTILYELYQSKKMINEKIQNQKCITLAYPFVEHNDLIDSLASLFYESARADGNLSNPSSLSNAQWYSLNAVEIIFDEPRNSPEDDLDELMYLQNWIDSSIARQAWGILLGHEVVPFDSLAGLIATGAWNPISNEWFTDLCEWLHNKSISTEVWVETISNVTRYIKERDNYYYTILNQNETQIKMLISDNLDDEIYNYPLTIFVKVPDIWEYALMIQGERIDTLNVFVNDSGKVVMADLIPDGGVVSLYKMNISGIGNSYNLVNDFELFQNYPNPFNPSTTIEYSISNSSFINLTIYDALGRVVTVLVDEEKSAGTYWLNFNAANLSSGIYIYTLRTDNKLFSKKMIVAK
jgi:hypothetical protein